MSMSHSRPSSEWIELGKFLAAGRAAVGPADVGLVHSGRRRTAGLRREEVALLAGIGVSWYTWIEQGRAENVSGEVLDSIARVLQFDENQRLYVRRLAGLEAKRLAPAEALDVPVLQPFVDNWGHNPAYITDRAWNIVVANTASENLFGLVAGQDNLLVHFFTDHGHRALYRDADRQEREMVARFRNQLGRFPDDTGIDTVIKQLTSVSKRFDDLWKLHEVGEDACGDNVLDHPTAGVLPMHWATLNFPDRVSISLTVFHPQVGHDIETALKGLAA